MGHSAQTAEVHLQTAEINPHDYSPHVSHDYLVNSPHSAPCRTPYGRCWGRPACYAAVVVRPGTAVQCPGRVLKTHQWINKIHEGCAFSIWLRACVVQRMQTHTCGTPRHSGTVPGQDLRHTSPYQPIHRNVRGLCSNEGSVFILCSSWRVSEGCVFSIWLCACDMQHMQTHTCGTPWHSCTVPWSDCADANAVPRSTHCDNNLTLTPRVLCSFAICKYYKSTHTLSSQPELDICIIKPQDRHV